MKRMCLVVFVVLICGRLLSAQNLTHESYEKAREIVNRSIAAYGGPETLRAIENLTVKAVGETVQRNQSRKTFMAERTPFRLEVTFDIKNARIHQITEGGYPGGFRYHNGSVVDKSEGTGLDFIRQTSFARPNLPPSVHRARFRLMPQLLVLNTVDRASRLRYLGEAEFDKRPHDVLSYANEDGAEVSLYFDRKTNLLSKFETLGTDVFFGDVVIETIYSGYRTEKGQPVPTGRSTRTNGELTEDLRFEQLTFNTALTDDKFKAPANFKPVTFPPAQPFAKISDNVYTVNAGGYNVLAVGFKDHVFVMEAPGGDNVSRQAIEQIKKLFPEKPIRYVAVTHHHDDHAGGLRTYIAEGATVLAAPGERSFFERIAKSKFTIDPDTLARNPKELKLETITGGRRVLTDGTTTVEIIDIGPGPHTEEMLVAYLPNEKMIFQGDLLNRPANGDRPIANDTTAHFAEWLANAKLPVEKIIPVHGTMTTVEELRQAVKEKESAANDPK